MADGLLGIDPGTLSQLQALMGQLGPSEQEKRAARAQAAILAGLGMIATPKGREWQTLPRAAAAGVMDYNQQLRDLGDDRLKRLQLAQALGKYQQQQQAQAQQQQYLKGMQDIFAGGPPSPTNMGMPSLAPTNANAAELAQRQAAAGTTSEADKYRKAAVQAALRGDSETAKRYADIAKQMDPEFSTTPVQFRTPEGIKSALISKRGDIKDLPHTVAEKAHFLDAGGRIFATDPYTGNMLPGGAAWEKSIDPSSRLSADVTLRGQDLTDARAREAAARGRWTNDLDRGVQVNMDTGETRPMTAGGAPIGPKPQPMTGAVQQQVASNAVTLAKIDRAMDVADKYPGAFGMQNYLGDPIMQRFDPKGVEGRALVADIAGQKIHDRSGAAVTVGEAERLKPYVPNVADDAATVKKKLALFKREYEAMQAELLGGRSLAEATKRQERRGRAAIMDEADAILRGGR